MFKRLLAIFSGLSGLLAFPGVVLASVQSVAIGLGVTAGVVLAAGVTVLTGGLDIPIGMGIAAIAGSGALVGAMALPFGKDSQGRNNAAAPRSAPLTAKLTPNSTTPTGTGQTYWPCGTSAMDPYALQPGSCGLGSGVTDLASCQRLYPSPAWICRPLNNSTDVARSPDGKFAPPKALGSSNLFGKSGTWSAVPSGSNPSYQFSATDNSMLAYITPDQNTLTVTGKDAANNTTKVQVQNYADNSTNVTVYAKVPVIDNNGNPVYIDAVATQSYNAYGSPDGNPVIQAGAYDSNNHRFDPATYSLASSAGGDGTTIATQGGSSGGSGSGSGTSGTTGTGTGGTGSGDCASYGCATEVTQLRIADTLDIIKNGPDPSTVPAAEEIQKKEIPVSFSEVSIPENATCPAPLQFVIHGHSFEIDFDPACTYASGIRPVFLAFAYLSAALIIIGAFKDG